MSVPTWLHRFRFRLVIAALASVVLVFGMASPAQATPADQTVSFDTSPPSPARYGGTYHVTASSTSGLTVTISVDGSSTGCTYNSGTSVVTFVSVGHCVLNANQAGNSNFNPGSAQQAFDIDPAPLTVSVSGGQTYGDSSTAYFSGTITGFQFSDDFHVITGTLSCTSGVTHNSGAGSYPISMCSGLSAPNYAISYDLGSVTVRQAQLTITANGATFTYGQSAPAITALYSGFVNGETSSVLTTQPTCSTPATSSSPVGSYASSCSGAAAANYEISYGGGLVTVTRASLIIKASSGSFTFGSSPPAVSASYTGFVNGDNASSLTTAPTCGSNADSSSPVGTYSTSCSGASSKNYTIAYQGGVMSVTKAVLTITASSASVGFGDDIPAITPGYSGFVNGDDANDLNAGPTCSTTATSTSPAGDYPTTCSGAAAANYTINYVHGTLHIVHAILTVTASSATIAYGDSPPAITPFYDGFQNGDTPASLTTQPSCGTTVTSATPAGSYASSCSGGISSNYTLIYVSGTITVKPRVLTVTASPVSRAMGGANAFAYSFSGFVNGDGPSAVSGAPAFSTSADATSEPGQYSITISAGSLSAANYSFAFVNGWLTVTKGTPHIVAAPASKSAALHNHKMTFSATATNSLSGLPIVGVTLKFTYMAGKTPITCSGVTNSSGVATCTNADGRLLLAGVGKPFTVTFAGNFDYLPGSANGAISA